MKLSRNMFRRSCWATGCVALVVVMCGAASSAQDPQSTEAKAVTIIAGPDWVPLKLDLDIEPGSALDFSKMGFQDAPAGKHGRVIATPDGQFAFEKDPKTPRRFYGVNLCFGAQYLTHTEAVRLADRLMRLGYNTVRIHHYERDLVQGQPDTTTLNPEKLDQLDFLIAALAKRGIYVTTDLFVSRPVTYKEIGIGREGLVGMDHFKILVPVNEAAWENLKKFSRALLGHVNPYTRRRYADEPALGWLSLINEGNFGNFFTDLRTVPEWNKAWNAWLEKRYGDRLSLTAAWGLELKDNEDFLKGSVAFPDRLAGDALRTRDCIAFLSATEYGMTERMIRFLRQELGCKTLITNTNSWTNHVTNQAARSLYDYTDDHFYIDHPRFLEKSWQLPSRCPNTSPIALGASGGRDRSFARLFDKPFTVTEYNYSGPGRFRGVGGILTGAMGSLQGWSGIWRFAYSHNRASILDPAPMGYFDMASDPLGQASERASLCLFLRGDMKKAPGSVAIVMTPKDLENPPQKIPTLSPRWHWAAWLTRVGMQVLPEGAGTPAFSMMFPVAWKTPAEAYSGSRAFVNANPYAMDDSSLLELLKKRGILREENPSDPAIMVFKSETGEITIDGPQDVMILDTAKTAGGYARAGSALQTRDGVFSVSMGSTDATVWVSSLDDRAIRNSKRLLVTHLTDLQNTGIRYAEEARQTLLAWGRSPHLVRAGKALVRIRLENAAKLKVWALSTSGRRQAQLKSKISKDILEIEVDVAANPGEGARMLYEIAQK